jgi:hypothetical protein
VDIELSKFKNLKEALSKDGVEITGDCSEKNIDKYIYFNMPYLTLKYWLYIIRNTKRSYLFCLEPPFVNPFNYFSFLYVFFDKVFFFDTKLMHGKKYYQAPCFQSSVNIDTSTVDFNEKSFLILINANKLPFFLFKVLYPQIKSLYEERIKIIEYFEGRKYPFDLYGRGWNEAKKRSIKEILLGFKKYSCYRGPTDNKNSLLSKYKFCICFENAVLPGYITEKIFDCFKAKCVPIYWGACDITSYIPESCFIDYRKFSNLDEMVIYLESVKEKEYLQYISSIETFLMNKGTRGSWFEAGLKDKVLSL